MNDDSTPPVDRRKREPAKRPVSLDEVFGDVLPDTTRDEQTGDRGATQDSSRDDELRREVPPHH